MWHKTTNQLDSTVLSRLQANSENHAPHCLMVHVHVIVNICKRFNTDNYSLFETMFKLASFLNLKITIFADLSTEEKGTQWKKCKGKFMNVAVFCIPGNSNVAPEGLSKFTHLNDGCMELVIVREVLRKDFIRFVKRHGNYKNQVLMPRFGLRCSII